MIDAMDKWLGRLPGRLGLLAVASGTLFSTFTGTSLATTAMLGEVLTPEMEARGYKKSMSLGPILGSGGLAMMIPPSGLAVFLGVVGEISIGKILIAIIIPGLLMAVLYATYIIIRCYLQPSIAPPYKVPPISLLEKLVLTAKYVLPLGFIIFLVIGVILLGVATPTEAAATGALGCFILTAVYGRLNWEVVKKATRGTLRVTVMILMIIVSAKAFSQVLAFSGASQGILELVVNLPIAPILTFISMQIVVLFLGMFMSAGAIILVTLPIYIPIVHALGFSEVWFAVVTLLNIEMATTSPPFGLALFVMRSVAPADTTIGDCYRAALPFLGCDLIAMAIIIAYPPLVLWLPGLMH
jgi:tripartite ATP-independent transporter DctM subunit